MMEKRQREAVAGSLIGAENRSARRSGPAVSNRAVNRMLKERAATHEHASDVLGRASAPIPFQHEMIRLLGEDFSAVRASASNRATTRALGARPDAQGQLQETDEVGVNAGMSMATGNDLSGDVDLSNLDEAVVYRTLGDALNAAMVKTQHVSITVLFVREQLAPGFVAARDATDVAATTELARAIVQGVSNARDELTEATNLSAEHDPTLAVSSEGGEALSIAQPTELDFGLHADLVTELDLASEDLADCELMLMTTLGPQEFRRHAVAGGYFRPSGDDRLRVIVREASFTVDLLITALAMQDRAEATDNIYEFREIVALAEVWLSRPINFHFLYRVLSQLTGTRFALLSAMPGPGGRSLREMRGFAQDNARTFGVMTDVGEYDPDRMADLLTYGAGDWAVTDENAKDAFNMIASAARDARAKILERLAEQGLLRRLCNNLPGQYTQALLDDIGGARGINASPVARIMQDCINENTGGGETVSEIYEDNIMENIREGNYVRAYLWTFLDVAHSATSLGFKDIHDQAYIARRQGLISSDEYLSTTAKAAGRSAALLAATAATGGAAGGLAEGFALGRGVQATTASLIGQGVGGGAAGLTGQLTADLYDQALLGKEGFSSLGDYGRSIGLGAGSGVLIGGVGLASARYLPGGTASAQRMFEYHSGSPAGQYRFAQGPRQALHAGLYRLYRRSSFAGRELGRRNGLPPEQYQEYFEFGSETARHHVFDGELRVNAAGDLRGSGGHLWPPLRAGGPGGGPKSAFPRTYNQERIMRIVTDAYTDGTTPWAQQSGPGQGTVHTGIRTDIRTNAGNPVRFRADIVVDGVPIRVIWEPGGAELVTAFPVGVADTANLLMSVPPYAAFAPGEAEE